MDDIVKAFDPCLDTAHWMAVGVKLGCIQSVGMAQKKLTNRHDMTLGVLWECSGTRKLKCQIGNNRVA